MPSFCGLPCCSSKDKRHPEEGVVEKPVYIAVPVQSSTTASVPTSQSKPIPTTPTPLESKDNQAETNEDIKNEPLSSADPPLSEKTEAVPPQDLPPADPEPNPINTNDTDDMNQLKGATSGVTDTVSSGAQQVASGAQGAASTAQSTASSGAEKVTSSAQGATGQSTATTGGNTKWDAMTEDQKKATYDALPADKKHDLSYYEWIKQGYHNSMENWMPWVEDMYLRWFTKDNKASYATKDTLDKSKITGIEQVDTLQDGVHNVVAGQVGQGGLLQPAGDMVSKEGVNRAERGGKDDSGSYAGAIGSSVSGAGGSLWSGAKSAGGYVGGMFGGGKTEQAPEQK